MLDGKKELKNKFDTEAQLKVMPLKELKKLIKNLEIIRLLLNHLEGLK